MSAIPTKEEILCTLEARHGKARQEKFSQAVVAVCGLGGLGSNIAIALARAGVGTLILTDFDVVDLSNLHRQQYSLSQLGQPKAAALAETIRGINPYVAVRTHTTRITQQNIDELLKDAHIVCEAFDDPEAKAMLANHVLETMPEKYLVSASGMAGLGSSNLIRTKRITKHFYLCGDGVSEVSEAESLVAARVMVCAGHQANMVLRLLAEEYEP